MCNPWIQNSFNNFKSSSILNNNFFFMKWKSQIYFDFIDCEDKTDLGKKTRIEKISKFWNFCNFSPHFNLRVGWTRSQEFSQEHILKVIKVNEVSQCNWIMIAVIFWLFISIATSLVGNCTSLELFTAAKIFVYYYSFIVFPEVQLSFKDKHRNSLKWEFCKER